MRAKLIGTDGRVEYVELGPKGGRYAGEDIEVVRVEVEDEYGTLHGDDLPASMVRDGDRFPYHTDGVLAALEANAQSLFAVDPRVQAIVSRVTELPRREVIRRAWEHETAIVREYRVKARELARLYTEVWGCS